MSPFNTDPALKLLATDEVIQRLVSTEAKDLSTFFSGDSVHDRDSDDLAERKGWSQLGLAAAMNSFRVSIMNRSEVRDPQAWVFAYLRRTARLRAIDAMRAAHLLGRKRNGTFQHPKRHDCRYQKQLSQITPHNREGRPVLNAHLADKIVGYGPSPHQIVEAADTVEFIGRQLDGLGRQVLQLHCIEGISLAEVAKRLGVDRSSLSNVKARIRATAWTVLVKNTDEECPTLMAPAA